MRGLIIGETQRKKIAELKAVAAANPFDAASIMSTAAKDISAYRDMMGTLTIDVPAGFAVTYSHERQPCGLCAHISISVDRPHKMPHPAAVEVLLEEFGMQPMTESLRVWIEEINPDTSAVNVLQQVEASGSFQATEAAANV